MLALSPTTLKKGYWHWDFLSAVDIHIRKTPVWLSGRVAIDLQNTSKLYISKIKKAF
jgi:hypothetical protein